MPLTLYHYTDYSGYIGIQHSQRIRKTAKNDPHAWYGEGVYLTSMPPEEGKLTIANNNYKRGGPNMMRNGRVSYYIKVKFDSIVNVKRVGGRSRDIYLYKDNDIDLNKYTHEFGKTSDEDSDSDLDYDYDYDSDFDLYL